MAWYEGTMTAEAGQLIAILYAKLPLNSCWARIDTPNTNEEVYEHKFNGTRDFVVYVKDNQSDYALVEIWDDWDTTGHAGVGNSLINSPGGDKANIIRKTLGAYGLRVDDDGFNFINKSSGWHYYVGNPSRFDTTRRQPIFIGHANYSSGSYYNLNPMALSAYYSSGNSGATWATLYDSAGGVRKWICFAGASFRPSPVDESSQSHYFLKTTANAYELFETRIQDKASPNLVFGKLTGVCSASYWTPTLSNGDTIKIEDVSWLVVKDATSGGTSLVRMD